MAFCAQVSADERQLLLAAIDNCIEDIWSSYDRDGNGFLDLHEAKKFLKDVIRESGVFSGEHFGEGGRHTAAEERHVREAFLEID